MSVYDYVRLHLSFCVHLCSVCIPAAHVLSRSLQRWQTPRLSQAPLAAFSSAHACPLGIESSRTFIDALRQIEQLNFGLSTVPRPAFRSSPSNAASQTLLTLPIAQGGLTPVASRTLISCRYSGLSTTVIAPLSVRASVRRQVTRMRECIRSHGGLLIYVCQYMR